MAKTIKPENLGAAIEQELKIYADDITEACDKISKESADTLVKLTRASAPTGKRGTFRKKISSKLLEKRRRSSTYVWYVKAPDYRLTHLLANGHATKDGGRTKANPFLTNALNVVLPAHERKIEEAIKK